MMNVTTIAGTGANSSTDGPALTASFRNPRGLAINSQGEVFVGEANCVRKISADGDITTFAGNAAQAGNQDGQGANARFQGHIMGMVFDSEDNLFLADYGNHSIRKIDPNGVVTTFVGSGTAGFADGQGIAAQFQNPWGLSIDGEDNLYVADRGNHRIRKIDPNGSVTTLAGSGAAGFADGQGTVASFNFPEGIAVDSVGNVFVGDYGNYRIRKITCDGIVTTFAGTGTAGNEDGVATVARFNGTGRALAIDGDDNLFVCGNSNHRIRQITPDGTTTTIAGSTAGFVDAQGTSARFKDPLGLMVAHNGNLLVAEYGEGRIRCIDAGLTPVDNGLVPELPSTHLTDLSALLDDDTFCDIEFTVGNETTTAHRNILSSRSDYFRTMFTGNFSEGEPNDLGRYECCVEDTTMPAFQIVLRYLYTDVLDLPSEHAVSVMRLAHQYNIERLYNHAVRFCTRGIDHSNVVIWFIEAHKHELDDLRENTKRYLTRNFRAIRDANKQSLKPLAEYPTLMMEVMLDAM